MEKPSSLTGTLTIVCILVLLGTMQLGVGWYLYKQLHADILGGCVTTTRLQDDFLLELQTPQSQDEVRQVVGQFETLQGLRRRRDIFDDEDARKQLCSLVEEKCNFPPPPPLFPDPPFKGQKGDKGAVGKPPYFPRLDNQAGTVQLEEPRHLVDSTLGAQPLSSRSRSSPHSQGCERFSRKVFVGGLPPDIDEDEITASFRRFGPLVVDWPHKAESTSYFPPKGYAFLLFQDENSVQSLIDACITDEDKLYLCVSSPTIKDKPVQIRHWRLSDADFVLDASMPLDPRKTVFVGGVPRPLKAVELAMIMDRLYGGVCYAGIDTDPELKYPKGAGRVAFSNQQSYIAAISALFVQLQHGDIDKRVEVKPYVQDNQMCDECQGQRCGGKFAPFFCANVTCLQYYCEHCWATIHSRPGREFHKPLVRDGSDRPRAVPFRWC